MPRSPGHWKSRPQRSKQVLTAAAGQFLKQSDMLEVFDLCIIQWQEEKMSCFMVTAAWCQSSDLRNWCPSWLSSKEARVETRLRLFSVEVKQKRTVTLEVWWYWNKYSHTTSCPIPKYKAALRCRHVATRSGYAWLKSACEDDNRCAYYTTVSVMKVAADNHCSVSSLCESQDPKAACRTLHCMKNFALLTLWLNSAHVHQSETHADQQTCFPKECSACLFFYIAFPLKLPT